jgi:hypothetical protein
LIGGLKALLKGGTVIGTGPDEIQIERSLPHGHVAAAPLAHFPRKNFGLEAAQLADSLRVLNRGPLRELQCGISRSPTAYRA